MSLIHVADSAFFQVFSFKLLIGNPLKALLKPYSVILTSSAARKYFGNEDPVGKTPQITTHKYAATIKNDFLVTGVMPDCPANSSIKFDFLASFDSLPAAKPVTEEWWNASYFSYLLLRSPQAIRSLQAKIEC